MVERNKFLWKKKKIIKAWTFAQKESSYSEERKSLRIFRVKERLILRISGSKEIPFSTQEIGRKTILIFTKLAWCYKKWERLSFSSQENDKMKFSDMENTFFFELKSKWKYDIYWLLKSSCFELFRDGKYVLFWAKKFMER